MQANRRQLLKSFGAMTSACLWRDAPAAAAFPIGPIRLVMPTPPGAGFDTIMRTLAERLGAAWGQSVVLDHKTGANGAIAAANTVQSPADGHTLLMAHSGVLTQPLIQPNPGYRMQDLAPVCLVATAPIVFCVSTSLGVKTLAEFVALAKARPGQLSYGSFGAGSSAHMLGELLNLVAGIDVVHVPYRGAAPAMQDMLGGQIQASWQVFGDAARYPDRVVCLAVATQQRFSRQPNVPTLAESGYANVTLPGVVGLFAPGRTDAAVIQKIASDTTRAIEMPAVREKILEAGFEPTPLSGWRFSAFLKEQQERVRALLATGRLKL